jgi:hypothetical protein
MYGTETILGPEKPGAVKGAERLRVRELSRAFDGRWWCKAAESRRTPRRSAPIEPLTVESNRIRMNPSESNLQKNRIAREKARKTRKGEAGFREKSCSILSSCQNPTQSNRIAPNQTKSK